MNSDTLTRTLTIDQAHAIVNAKPGTHPEWMVDAALMTIDGIQTCQWFAMCPNDANGVVSHVILGDVPCCQRCADKLGLHLTTVG